MDLDDLEQKGEFYQDTEGSPCTCGGTFKLRTWHEVGEGVEQRFLGCSNYPRCSETRELPVNQ